MAELADSKFWLPSEFLDDDDMLVKDQDEVVEEEEKKDNNNNHQMECDEVHFPSEFPYFCEPNHGSPVESMADTESNEDEEQRVQQHVADLNHEKGRASLCSAFAACDQKEGSMAGSLQSICAMRRMSISRRGRSDEPSQVSTLLSPMELQRNHEWGLLYDAAGQVERLKRQEETGENGISKGTAAAASSTIGYHSNPVSTQYQLQATHRLRQQQLPKQRLQCSSGWGGRQLKGRRGHGFGQGRATNWPRSSSPQQFQMGSGMTAIFLGSGAKEPGTGVFLPRRDGADPSEMPRKPACSTVLLPARVVQALNLDLDEVGRHDTHPGGLVLDYDGIKARSAEMLLQKKRQQILRSQQAMIRFNTESGLPLPPDWSY